MEINRFKVKKGYVNLETDMIAIEEPLQISLMQEDLKQVFSITLRTPGQDRELVLGLLFCEGVIDSAEDITSITEEKNSAKIQSNLLVATIQSDIDINLDNSTRRFPSYSGCGLCGKTSLQALELRVAREQNTIEILFNNTLVKQIKAWLATQPLFCGTGGTHVAGLIYADKQTLNFSHSTCFEDVGRHNALDKLIGHELLTNNLQRAGVLVLSGRIGFELVQKSVVAGFSAIVALGAPSNLAIQAANQFNIMLIGFAKDDSFNLYTSDTHLLK